MDYPIRQLVKTMVVQLEELQDSEPFASLLNCTETDLKEEAMGLYMEINALKNNLKNMEGNCVGLG